MRERVAIVGTGIVGRAWAISFARGGCETRLYDVAPEAVADALGAIDRNLVELEDLDLLGGASAGEVRSRITGASERAQALDGATHVQECVPETVAAKTAVFAWLDTGSDAEAVLASSSTGIPPSAFTEDLAGRGRCLVAHPINPPYLVPAVELVPAPWTEEAAMRRTRALMERIGQAPISMTREIEGFIMNRLQGALLQEAFWLVENGYASVEDVDRGLAQGIGLRWSFIGPFETTDLNAPGGVRDYVDRYGAMYLELARGRGAPAPWTGAILDAVETQRRAALPLDGIADRQAWRDRRLMALAAHKRKLVAEEGKASYHRAGVTGDGQSPKIDQRFETPSGMLAARRSGIRQSRRSRKMPR